MAPDRKDRIQRFPEEYDDSLPNITISEYVLEHVHQFGDKVACIDAETKEELTFKEMADTIEHLAAGLTSQFHLKVTDVVAIVLPSCLQYSVAVLAVNLCGSAAALINPEQTISELKHNLNLSKPKLWITTEHYISKHEEIYKDIPSNKRPPIILLTKGHHTKKHYTTWAELIAVGKKNKNFKPPKINAKEDVALILYSSGTTGLPKGVCLTHLNYTTGRRQNVELTKNIPPNPEDLNVVMLPLYHTFGMSTIMDNMVRGLGFILIPHFSFVKMLEAIQEYRITIMSVVPAICNQLVKQPIVNSYDLSSLRVFFCGAAALSKEVAAQVTEKFGVFVFAAYGMTESTLRTHCNFIGYTREGSIGVVMPFCESIVVDVNTNEALGPNEEGEICVRGPLVMKGYIGNEEATRNTIEPDGWLHTGDIGYYDDDGFFFITDRAKELIKYKGLQVSPTELEQILNAHPAVLDSAVGSIPDEEAGEVPRAYVVRNPASKVTEEELARYVADKVSPHKRLRAGVIFVNSIPRNPTGKILRRELRKITSKL